jgi:hypothetical protein
VFKSPVNYESPLSFHLTENWKINRRRTMKILNDSAEKPLLRKQRKILIEKLLREMRKF